MWSLTNTETKSTFALAGLFSIRMLALFMILPVLQLYLDDYAYASTTMLGWVIGIYGLSQAVFQIPLGRLSDKIGRRPVILGGLVVFMIGSVMAAITDSVVGLLVGRALQGAGAIGSTLLAYVADSTRDEVRTRAMAIIGISIGFSFLLAMILGPLVSAHYGLQGIFWFTFGLGGLGMLWLLSSTKQLPSKRYFNEKASWGNLLKDAQLWRLNVSIFILHGLFAGCFVFLPKMLLNLTHLPEAKMWQIYLPVLFGSLILMMPFVRMADKPSYTKPVFWGSIVLYGGAIAFMSLFPLTKMTILIALVVFFAAFNVLESQLPSWVSKVAPTRSKGAALGLYSTSQFLGIFFGGVTGGMLDSQLGIKGMGLWALLLVSLWLISTLGLVSPKKAPEVQS